jgi:hypothetical protein
LLIKRKFNISGVSKLKLNITEDFLVFSDVDIFIALTGKDTDVIKIIEANIFFNIKPLRNFKSIKIISQNL